jgi:hypothetical protein
MNDTELKNLIARNPIHPKYGVPVPLIMICNVTGVEKKYTAPEYIKGKLDGAGGLENFLKTYVSKGAGKDAKGASKAPKVSTTKTWGGEAIIKPDVKVEVKEEPSTDPADTITHYYLNHDHGEDSISTTTHPRQNPEQKKINVHDFRKNKSEPFSRDGLFPETIEILKNAGIVLARK